MVAIYPREGTETFIAAANAAGVMVAIYPREGTETPGILSRASDSHRCNLSPRGDGNLLLQHNVFFCNGSVAIYPREGTETCLGVSVPQAKRVAIYPREGTET